MQNLELVNKIKSLRQKKAWTQAQLAEIASISLRTIQRVERSGHCSKETLLAIASAFDIDVNELSSLVKTDYKARKIFGLDLSIFTIDTNKALVYSILLMLPAFLFIAYNVMHYQLHINIFNPFGIFYSTPTMLSVFNLVGPIIFIGGLKFGIFINLWAMTNFSIEKEDTFIDSFIRFSPRAINIILILLSTLSIFVLFSFALLENLAV